MKKTTLIFYFISICSTCFPQAPSIQWAKCFGGTDQQMANACVQTADGGFAVIGTTYSNDGNVSGNHGISNIWVIKLDSLGNLVWQKCFGGSLAEMGFLIKQTFDGGYVLVGQSVSDDFDLAGHFNFTDDFWLIKVDSAFNIQWSHCYGGSGGEWPYDIQQTSDSGFIIAGNCGSNDGDVIGYHGGVDDGWLVKTDKIGNLIWAKTYGGTSRDEFSSVRQLNTGGYIVAGGTTSNDGDVSGSHGNGDGWLLKLTDSGEIIWQKCIGGSYGEVFIMVEILSDSEYVLSGITASNDGDISGNHGNADAFLLKADSSGAIIWQKCYGTSDFEGPFNSKLTSDGGFVFVGRSFSNDSIAHCDHGDFDFYTLKVDSAGNELWTVCMGGSIEEEGYGITDSRDGGYLVVGKTDSNDGDVSGRHSINYTDYWVVKLAPIGLQIEERNPLMDFSAFINYPALQLHLNFFMNESENIQLEVYDITERVILKSNFNTSNGFNSRIIGIPDISPGVYVVRLSTTWGSQTKKVIVEK